MVTLAKNRQFTVSAVLGFIALIVAFSGSVLQANDTDTLEDSDSTAIIVRSLGPRSDLKRAGVQAGDRITGWGEADTTVKPMPGTSSFFAWQWFRYHRAPLGTSWVHVNRNGENLTLTVPGPDWTGNFDMALPEALLDRFRDGLSKVAANDVAGGIATWRALESELPRAGQVWLSLAIGNTFRDRNDVEPALAAYASGFALATHPMEKIVLYWARGWLLLTQRRFDEASQDFEEAKRLLVDHWGESFATATTRYQLGIVFWRADQQASTLENMAAAVDQLENLAPSSYTTLASNNLLAASQTRLGLYGEAHQTYERVWELMAPYSEDPRIRIPSLNNLGVSLLNMGDFDGATEKFETALELAKSSGNVDAIAKMIHNLALVALRHGDFAEEEVYRLEVLSMLRNKDGDPLALARALESIGEMYVRHRNYTLAERFLLEALDQVAEHGNGGITHAGILQTLAYLRRIQGRLGAAISYAEESLPIFSRQHEGHPNLLLVNNLLGEIYLKRGDLDNAARVLQKAESLIDARDVSRWRFVPIFHNLAWLAWRQGDVARISEWRNQAEALLDNTVHPPWFAVESHYQWAKLAKAQGDLSLAAERFYQALSSLNDQLPSLADQPMTQAVFHGSYASVYRNLIDTLVMLGRNQEAYIVSESFRAYTFRSQLTQAQSSRSPAQEQAWRTRARLDALHAALTDADESSSAAFLQKQILQLLEEAHQNQDLLPDFDRTQWQDRWTDLSRSVPDKTLVLSFVMLEQAILQFSLFNGELRVRRIPVARGQLDQRIQDLVRVSTIPNSQSASKKMTRLSESLARDLLTPAEAEIAACERFLVIPDGQLNQVPFSLLLSNFADGQSGQKRATQKPVSAVASLTVLLELSKRQAQNDFMIAGFGQGRVEVGRQDGLRTLHAVDDELAMLKRAYGKSARIFTGRSGTWQNFTDYAARARMVHFAGHATFNAENPFHSSLVFQHGDATRGDRNELRLIDIMTNLKLKADLVVLSACQTGSGRHIDGEGVIGMARAFHAIGARSLIASLWRVPDRATAALMTTFYNNLQQGMDLARSLHLARAALRDGDVQDQSGREDWRHPFFWAGFQLHGPWE